MDNNLFEMENSGVSLFNTLSYAKKVSFQQLSSTHGYRILAQPRMTLDQKFVYSLFSTEYPKFNFSNNLGSADLTLWLTFTAPKLYCKILYSYSFVSLISLFYF